MRQEMLAVALLLWAGGAAADDAPSRLTQGKLDADLGNREAAAAAFAEVADDTSAPAALRWEALVRLGLVRRDAGDAKGAVQAYQQAWERYGQDKEARRFLAQAIAKAVPGRERWDAIWQRVALKVDGARTNHPVARIEWPGVPAPRSYTGQPITFDFKDGSLNDLFRLMADVTGLNVVVHPGVRGTITVSDRSVPWDEMLDRVLAPNGLAASRVGNVLEIALPERLGTRRDFVGKPGDLDYDNVELQEGLRRIADRGGRDLTVEPYVAGHVTIRLVAVPWDQTFDLIVRVNGLAYKDDGKVLRVGRAADLR